MSRLRIFLLSTVWWLSMRFILFGEELGKLFVNPEGVLSKPMAMVFLPQSLSLLLTFSFLDLMFTSAFGWCFALILGRSRYDDFDDLPSSSPPINIPPILPPKEEEKPKPEKIEKPEEVSEAKIRSSFRKVADTLKEDEEK